MIRRARRRPCRTRLMIGSTNGSATATRRKSSTAFSTSARWRVRDRRSCAAARPCAKRHRRLRMAAVMKRAFLGATASCSRGSASPGRTLRLSSAAGVGSAARPQTRQHTLRNCLDLLLHLGFLCDRVTSPQRFSSSRRYRAPRCWGSASRRITAASTTRSGKRCSSGRRSGSVPTSPR